MCGIHIHGHTKTWKGQSKSRVKGVIKDILHDQGPGALLAVVHFRDLQKAFVSADGIYTGQFVYCGMKAQLQIGNVDSIDLMSEVNSICNLEERTGDRGKLARFWGNYDSMIAHNSDTGKTRVKLLSGAKKIGPSANRVMVGIVASYVVLKSPSLRLAAPTTNTRWNAIADLGCVVLLWILSIIFTVVVTINILVRHTLGFPWVKIFWEYT